MRLSGRVHFVFKPCAHLLPTPHLSPVALRSRANHGFVECCSDIVMAQPGRLYFGPDRAVNIFNWGAVGIREGRSRLRRPPPIG